MQILIKTNGQEPEIFLDNKRMCECPGNLSGKEKEFIGLVRKNPRKAGLAYAILIGRDELEAKFSRLTVKQQKLILDLIEELAPKDASAERGHT